MTQQLSLLNIFCFYTISVLYCAHLCMKCSLGISNFLEKISSLSHFFFLSLYFFALITKEVFRISPCYFLELCIQIGTSFLFSSAFSYSSQLFVRPPQTAVLPFGLFFILGDGLDRCLLYYVTNLCP